MTQVHLDHVGWNDRFADERWVPTFPNAKYIFSRIEQRYNANLSGHQPASDLPPSALGKPLRQPAPGVYDASVAPIIDVGLAELIVVVGAHPPHVFSFFPTPRLTTHNPPTR